MLYNISQCHQQISRYCPLTGYRWRNMWIETDDSFHLLKFYLNLVLPNQVKCKPVRKRKNDGKL